MERPEPRFEGLTLALVWPEHGPITGAIKWEAVDPLDVNKYPRPPQPTDLGEKFYLSTYFYSLRASAKWVRIADLVEGKQATEWKAHFELLEDIEDD